MVKLTEKLQFFSHGEKELEILRDDLIKQQGINIKKHAIERKVKKIDKEPVDYYLLTIEIEYAKVSEVI